MLLIVLLAILAIVILFSISCKENFVGPIWYYNEPVMNTYPADYHSPYYYSVYNRRQYG